MGLFEASKVVEAKLSPYPFANFAIVLAVAGQTTTKSFFLDKVMGSLFKKATIKMLDAFEQRARSLHN